MLLHTPAVFLEGFSITHAAILDGETSADEAAKRDFYGVQSASVSANAESYEEKSNDIVIGTWNDISSIEIEVNSGFMSLSIFDRFSIEDTKPLLLDLWNPSAINPVHVPILFRIPSRNQNGVYFNFDIVLFNVKLKPYSIDSLSYKEGLRVSYKGQAFLSDVNEVGEPLGTRSFGSMNAYSLDSLNDPTIIPEDLANGPDVPDTVPFPGEMIYPDTEFYPEDPG